mmetsp:Transcript_9920/g.26212  ORF Transcript_9920/g.26212 Transcript_9920/m.26212 type:complete len:232 (+) Transcript_9920:2113-2808(+)
MPNAVPQPLVLGLPQQLGDCKVSSRDVPRCTPVDVAQEDICAGLDEHLHDMNVASVASKVQRRPEVRTSPEVEIEGPRACTDAAALRLLMGGLVRALPFQARAVDGIYVAQHETDTAELPAAGREVERCPFVAVHQVTIGLVPQQDLADRGSLFAALVEHGHEHMQWRVAVLIHLVHVGPALDKQHHHVRVEVDSGDVQRGTEETATAVHVDAGIDERGGYVWVFLPHCHE